MTQKTQTLGIIGMPYNTQFPIHMGITLVIVGNRARFKIGHGIEISQDRVFKGDDLMMCGLVFIAAAHEEGPVDHAQRDIDPDFASRKARLIIPMIVILEHADRDGHAQRMHLVVGTAIAIVIGTIGDMETGLDL